MPKQPSAWFFARSLPCNVGVLVVASTVLLTGVPHLSRADEAKGKDGAVVDFNALPPAPGLIFDVQAGEYILFDEFVHRLMDRKYILIGEKHDNPVHHHHQSQLVAALSQADQRHRAVIWEMFTRDQQASLDENWQELSASDLGPALDWDSRGWPSWHDYAPIAQAAKDNNLPMVAGNLPEDVLRPMISDGVSALPDDLAQKLALPEIPKDILERFNVEIAESHCNMLPESMLGGFSTVQFARDASLARAMFDASEVDNTQGAFLIAGAMHVRNSIAVPWHLKRFDADLDDQDIAVISLIEADDPGDTPSSISDYAMRFGAADDIDFMWFTNDIVRGDPCTNITIGQ